MQAMRLVLDRVVPTMKAKDSPVIIGKLDGSLSDQGRTVLNAMSDGSITPDEAATLMQAIGVQARIIAVDELERRVSAIEEKQDSQSTGWNMNLESRLIKLERTGRMQTGTLVVWIRRFGFAEEDAIGAKVRKDGMSRDVARLPAESVEGLIKRAIAALPKGGLVTGWLYAQPGNPSESIR
jgi:hypothetical protein